MTAMDIFQILQKDIHSTVFATLDENGLPQTCVIDPSHCIHCGSCFRICPVKAVEKLG